MHNFIKIFKKFQEIGSVSFSEFEPRQVQEIGSFSLFQNLELSKPRSIENVSFQSLGLDLDNINVYAKVYENVPLSSRDRTIFTFSEFGTRQSLDR